jgi:hypothetical protein
VQWRATSGYWLGPKIGRCYLIAIVDGRTGVAQARFARNDSVEENLRVLELYVQQWGCPPSIHSNRKTLFRGNPRSSSVERGDSRIQRTLQDLGIKWAGDEASVSARRLGQLLGTADCIARELAQSRVKTFDAANRYLQVTFLPRWLLGCTVPAKHRAPPVNLARVLSKSAVRCIQADGSLQYNGKRYVVKRALPAGTAVQIETRLDGTTHAYVAGKLAPLEERAKPIQPVVPAQVKNKVDRRHRHFAKNREWMTNFFKRPQPPLWLLLKPQPKSE